MKIEVPWSLLQNAATLLISKLPDGHQSELSRLLQTIIAGVAAKQPKAKLEVKTKLWLV